MENLNLAAKFLVMFLAFSCSLASAEMRCFKARTSPFASVSGHPSRDAELYLALSDADNEFDQLLLSGTSVRVKAQLNCGVDGKTRHCNLPADGGELTIREVSNGAVFEGLNGNLALRSPDDSGELYFAVQKQKKVENRREYIFEALTAAACKSLFKPAQFDGNSADDDTDGLPSIR